MAVPTAPRRSIDELEGAVDAVFCPNIRDTARFAVAEAYLHWRDLAEADVTSLLASRGLLP